MALQREVHPHFGHLVRRAVREVCNSFSAGLRLSDAIAAMFDFVRHGYALIKCVAIKSFQSRREWRCPRLSAMIAFRPSRR